MAIGLGKIASRIGNSVAMAGHSKKAMGALGIGAFGLGVANTAAPVARDAAFDVAFGDPNADVAFTGRKIDSRFLAGSAMPGPLGFAARASAPSDYLTFSSPAPSAAEGFVGAAVGGTVGAVAGSLIKGKVNRGRMISGGIMAASTLVGAGIGGSNGLLRTRALMANNQQFYSESPYARNSSRNIVAQTNAVGDIVLGMHNSRSGY